MTDRGRAREFQIPCTISVHHTDETLEAHVELDGGVLPDVGDQIRVHGAGIVVPFGESITITRMATVRRASALEKLWVRLKAQFELAELYEVSFTTGRL